jgi:outer membrane immunogenic protein
MIKKIVFLCGMACALSANAQSSNFEGASVALNVNSATIATNIASTVAVGESSTNGSIQGAYSFALSETGLFSVGATYALGDLKAGSISESSITLKAKNFYTIYAEPAIVNGNTAFYGKLAYIATKGVLTASGATANSNFSGIGYGVGIRTLMDKNMYVQVEFMNSNFDSKTINTVTVEPDGTIGTIGIGYKF